MKKSYFNLIFLVLIFVLIILFMLSGLKITQSKTETMAWNSIKFILTDLTKTAGVLLILTLSLYFFLKRKHIPKANIKNKNAQE